jgi:hypothetical protein
MAAPIAQANAEVYALNLFDDRVPFLSCRQLKRSMRIKVRMRHWSCFVGHRLIVEAGAPTLDQAACFGVRGSEASTTEKLEHRYPAFEF